MKPKLALTHESVKKLADKGLKPNDIQVEGFDVVAPEPKKLPATVIVTLHLHSSKEESWTAAQEAGITDEKVLKTAMYLGYQHKLEFEVSTTTGEGKLIRVDGRELK